MEFPAAVVLAQERDRQPYAESEFFADIGEFEVVGPANIQAKIDHATAHVLKTA